MENLKKLFKNYEENFGDTVKEELETMYAMLVEFKEVLGQDKFNEFVRLYNNNFEEFYPIIKKISEVEEC